MTDLMAVPSRVEISGGGAVIDSSYAVTRTAPLHAARHYPSPQEWESQKTEIGRLYLDERKTLKEVIELMARVHGHHGT